jgi:hypothetical protein
MSDRDDLAALAAFLPLFRDEGFVAGRIKGGNRNADGVVSMPYADYTAEVGRFLETAYGNGWIISFNWSEWSRSDEARQLLRSEDGIERASLDQLRRLVTCILRQDRFVEGTLLRAFEDGIIPRIVERAAVLLDEGGGVA